VPVTTAPTNQRPQRKLTGFLQNEMDIPSQNAYWTQST